MGLIRSRQNALMLAGAAVAAAGIVVGSIGHYLDPTPQTSGEAAGAHAEPAVRAVSDTDTGSADCC